MVIKGGMWSIPECWVVLTALDRQVIVMVGEPCLCFTYERLERASIRAKWKKSSQRTSVKCISLVSHHMMIWLFQPGNNLGESGSNTVEGLCNRVKKTSQPHRWLPPTFNSKALKVRPFKFSTHVVFGRRKLSQTPWKVFCDIQVGFIIDVTGDLLYRPHNLYFAAITESYQDPNIQVVRLHIMCDNLQMQWEHTKDDCHIAINKNASQKRYDLKLFP